GDEVILFNSRLPNKVYASFDNGATWDVVKEETYSIVSLDYLDGKFVVSTLNGASLSVDEGKTWSDWEKPLSSASIHDVVLGDNDGPPQLNVNAYVMSSHGGRFETNDGGRTYNRMGIPGAKVHDIVLTQSPNTNLLFNGDAKDQSEHIIAGTDWDSYKTEIPKTDSIVN